MYCYNVSAVKLGEHIMNMRLKVRKNKKKNTNERTNLLNDTFAGSELLGLSTGGNQHNFPP